MPMTPQVWVSAHEAVKYWETWPTLPCRLSIVLDCGLHRHFSSIRLIIVDGLEATEGGCTPIRDAVDPLISASKVNPITGSRHSLLFKKVKESTMDRRSRDVRCRLALVRQNEHNAINTCKVSAVLNEASSPLLVILQMSSFIQGPYQFHRIYKLSCTTASRGTILYDRHIRLNPDDRGIFMVLAPFQHPSDREPRMSIPFSLYEDHPADQKPTLDLRILPISSDQRPLFVDPPKEVLRKIFLQVSFSLSQPTYGTQLLQIALVRKSWAFAIDLYFEAFMTSCPLRLLRFDRVVGTLWRRRELVPYIRHFDIHSLGWPFAPQGYLQQCHILFHIATSLHTLTIHYGMLHASSLVLAQLPNVEVFTCMTGGLGTASHTSMVQHVIQGWKKLRQLRLTFELSNTTSELNKQVAAPSYSLESLDLVDCWLGGSRLPLFLTQLTCRLRVLKLESARGVSKHDLILSLDSSKGCLEELFILFGSIADYEEGGTFPLETLLPQMPMLTTVVLSGRFLTPGTISRKQFVQGSRTGTLVVSHAPVSCFSGDVQSLLGNALVEGGWKSVKLYTETGERDWPSRENVWEGVNEIAKQEGIEFLLRPVEQHDRVPWKKY